jgi:hypothetical protein
MAQSQEVVNVSFLARLIGNTRELTDRHVQARNNMSSNFRLCLKRRGRELD